ncbi:sigma-70 family RNA polymerase sigma factor [Staphylococcus simulans]|uniref:RNA polymerase sigma factor n=2 Tax=Staphylococcus TaxID=1279 RepID=UPI0021D1F1E8|nr:sigma-70 family RNA polymerase sigma factor [Staphylococcus simulans]UXR30155.1 sigma-70 family RNA polymerase sigma factor [Staphylococcus simulans]
MQKTSIPQDIVPLIHLAQMHDDHAMHQLLEVLQPFIRSRLIHPSIAPHDCDDLIQDISLRISRNIYHFKTIETIPFEHYFNRLVSTSKYDYYRRQKRLRLQQDCLVQEAECSYRAQLPSVEAQLILKERSEILLNCCKKLSKLEREVVQYILDDYSPSETAQAMDLSEKAVYNALHRSKVKLRKMQELLDA